MFQYQNRNEHKHFTTLKAFYILLFTGKLFSFILQIFRVKVNVHHKELHILML